MLTIKAEVLKNKRRVDLSYNVKLRFTLNRQVRRVSTSLFARQDDLQKNLVFKTGTALKKDIDKLVSAYYDECAKLQIELHDYSLDEVLQLLANKRKRGQVINFIEFSRNWINSTDIKGVKNYASALNALIEYNKGDFLDINNIRRAYLSGFREYLYAKHEQRNKELSKNGKRLTSNRMVSLYLGSIRHLFYEAKRKYNDYDSGVILIPNNPFEGFTIPKQEMTRKRAIPAEIINKIAHLPYRLNADGTERVCQYNLAKDCFILSFCLIGMNSADMHNCTEYESNTIAYYRTKTTGRRQDKAMMKVLIQPCVVDLFSKYRDETGKRVFNFYQKYSTAKNFNRAINKGLKEIGELLGINDLEFYAARHSWATIALNRCQIDKYTVHAALNHLDETMRVTDIYIERDFEKENDANQKVTSYVFC